MPAEVEGLPADVPHMDNLALVLEKARAGLRMSAPSILDFLRHLDSIKENWLLSRCRLLVLPLRLSRSVASCCKLMLRSGPVLRKPNLMSMTHR